MRTFHFALQVNATFSSSKGFKAFKFKLGTGCNHDFRVAALAMPVPGPPRTGGGNHDGTGNYRRRVQVNTIISTRVSPGPLEPPHGPGPKASLPNVGYANFELEIILWMGYFRASRLRRRRRGAGNLNLTEKNLP
jgi:hypothetical protein